MKKITFSNFAGDDLYEFIEKTEKSFDIKFRDNELESIATIDDFAEHIARKLDLNDTADCTTQQAFYKLREAIAETAGISKNSIAPTAAMEELVPKKQRRQIIKSLEKNLGFGLNLLQPKDWVSIPLFFILALGFIALFFNAWYGAAGIAFSAIGLKLAYTFGTDFTMGTPGEIAEKMAVLHYRKSRRSGTINRKEISKTLTLILMDVMGADTAAQLEQYATPA